MRRLFLLVAVLALGFYVAWPAWSGYQIKSAIDRQDAALLARKIDFPSVRASLQPYVTDQVNAQVDKAIADMGPAAAVLAAQLKTEMAPKLAAQALDRVVTAENIIKVVSEGGTVKTSVDAVMRDEIGKLGGGAPGSVGTLGGLGSVLGGLGVDPGKIPGFGQAPTAPQAPAAASVPVAKASYGLGNIKSFSISGPTSFEIGAARDQAAVAPEVKAQMAFTGFDWKLVGVRPQ